MLPFNYYSHCAYTVRFFIIYKHMRSIRRCRPLSILLTRVPFSYSWKKYSQAERNTMNKDRYNSNGRCINKSCYYCGGNYVDGYQRQHTISNNGVTPFVIIYIYIHAYQSSMLHSITLAINTVDPKVCTLIFINSNTLWFTYFHA